ncbi:DUF5119 domain-containing protein [uncultured Muribaculum sp.]|uniref:DUF5119 domain-containing protein n=1 Tax=uncultured Muribaculum sp. TaxID=1918613 RepID=UPI00259CCC8C|nr:DUF5119 domain-containing protein [uncultured Muribaculum sp.]
MASQGLKPIHVTAIPGAVMCRATIIAALLAIMSAIACSKSDTASEIMDHTVSVSVTFDMRYVGDQPPAGMTLYLYPLDENLETRRFDFKGITGGKVDIKPGRYNIICYNNDTHGVDFRNTDRYDSHEAYTRQSALNQSPDGNNLPVAPGAEDEQLLICPDPMTGTSISNVSLESNDVTLTLQPRRLTCTYRYEITDVTNIGRVTSMFASISGMTSSLLLCDGNPGSECATLVSEAVSDGMSRITGEFVTFRHDNGCNASHHLMLYVWTDDGKLHCLGGSDTRFDMTEKLHQSGESGSVTLTVNGLEIPQSHDPEGTGYTPDIDDWPIVDTDIDI